jgi:hypothetical protein
MEDDSSSAAAGSRITNAPARGKIAVKNVIQRDPEALQQRVSRDQLLHARPVCRLAPGVWSNVGASPAAQSIILDQVPLHPLAFSLGSLSFAILELRNTHTSTLCLRSHKHVRSLLLRSLLCSARRRSFRSNTQQSNPSFKKPLWKPRSLRRSTSAIIRPLGIEEKNLSHTPCI